MEKILLRKKINLFEIGEIFENSKSNFFQEGNLDSKTLSPYQDLINQRIGGELSKGSHLRKAFLSLNDEQLSEIIDILGEPKVKEAIEKTGDLDYASLAAFSVLKAQPKLIKFAPLLLKPFI